MTFSSKMFCAFLWAGFLMQTLFVDAAQKRIYIAPDDHTDYMWKGDVEDYRQAFVEMLDYYLNQIDSTASEIPEHQARWNCDGHFWVWTYEQEKSGADFNRLINRIRDGHISMPLNCIVPAHGGTPMEGVIREMLYAGTLERRFNLRFPLVASMENQTLPYGLGAIYAGAGARYSWRGICGCATKVSNPGDREHDIYWWQGPDGSRILMKWNTMHGSNEGMGGYAEARDPSAVVEFVDNDPDFIARYPYDVIGAFGYGWDDLKSFTTSFVSTAKAKTNSSRKVIVSNERDFFEDFEANYATNIPAVNSSFGNEWELNSASMAEVSAIAKRSVEKLRTAEAMASIVSLYHPTFMDSLKSLPDNAWIRMGMYWDHNWTADSSTISRSERAAWQRQLAAEMAEYSDTLESAAAQSLSAMIDDQEYTECFVVFNSLGWERTGVADLPANPVGLFHVMDVASGTEVPSQKVTIDGHTRVRILASNIPSVGFRLYAILTGQGAVFPPAVTLNGSAMENARYQLTLETDGAISSLIDKTAGNKEYAAQIDGKYLNDLGTGSGTITATNVGPVSATLVADSTTPISHKTSVTLFSGQDWVDVHNRITQNFSSTQSWTFSFNLASPEIHHEEVGAILKAKLTTQGGHYSPRNARYDWLTMNHFADIRDSSGGVTISNADCYYMQIGDSTTTFLDTATPQISVLAGGQVDGPSLGIPSQGGDSSFTQRFALKTNGGSFNAQDSLRFALEHQNPLFTRKISGSGVEMPNSSSGFLNVSNPKILLWALKPPEDGGVGRLIVRLFNTAETTEVGTLSFPNMTVLSASQATHVETETSAAPILNNSVQLSFAPRQIKTYAVTVKGDFPKNRARKFDYP